MARLHDHNEDGRSRTITFSGTAAVTGVGIVLLSAVLVAGFLVLHGNRRTGLIGHSTLNATVSQQKPSPGIPFAARSSKPVATVASAPALAPVEAAVDTPTRLGPAGKAPGVYFAKHQKIFGRGCDGRLALTAKALDFACAQGSEAPLHFTVGEIKGPNGNGIQLKSGEKYHFDLGASKAEEQQIFADWANAHIQNTRDYSSTNR